MGQGGRGREGEGGREGREERTVPPRSVNPGYGPVYRSRTLHM